MSWRRREGAGWGGAEIEKGEEVDKGKGQDAEKEEKKNEDGEVVKYYTCLDNGCGSEGEEEEEDGFTGHLGDQRENEISGRDLIKM